MNYTEIVAEVLKNLGNPTDTETLAVVQSKVNFVLTEDLHAQGMPHYDVVTDGVTVALTEYAALPTGLVSLQHAFIREQGQTNFEYRIALLPPEEMLLLDTGKPRKGRLIYSTTLGAMAFYLRPIPEVIYDIRYYYKKKEVAISGTQTAILSTIYGDYPIIAGATFHSALLARRDETSGRWWTEYDKAMKQLIEWFRNTYCGYDETPGLYV